MKKTRVLVIALVFIAAPSIFLTGCGDKFFDPTQVGRFRPVPAVNVILDSLGVEDETPDTWAGAEDPRPIDAISYEPDYVFSSGDFVRISIFELLSEGVMFTDQYIVTETGKISIRDVGTVQVAGLTETQLEDEIRQILAPGILKEPSVSVILLSSQKRVFSIAGLGIPQPSRYSIPRYDFRLLDALAVAGGISQFNISYVYVSRPVTGEEEIAEPAVEFEQIELKEPELKEPELQPELRIKPEQEMLEIIAPRAQKSWRNNMLVITTSELATDNELTDAAAPQDFDLPEQTPDIEQSIQKPAARQMIEPPINEPSTETIEWIFNEQTGKWEPVITGKDQWAEQITKPVPAKEREPLKEQGPEGFTWDEIGRGGKQTRLIRIPADKLLAGDPKYNIVIKPGDNIQVPIDMIGEYYIMGNTTFTGPVVLTGRPLTLKMAIAAAGGLGPLAWPKKCEIIRRIGKNKEETVMVDLEKIFSGEQPDFYIKHLDLINVGTHPTARWRAVLRNAFRAAYGFAFVYDRNYGERDFDTRRPLPHWF